MLGKITVYIAIFLSYFSYVLMYHILTSEKIKLNSKKFIVIMLLSYISYIINSISSVFINLLLTLLIIFLLIKSFFKRDFKKNLYYTIFLIFITLISDLLTSFLINSKYIENFLLFRNNVLLRSILSLPVIIMSIIICTLPFIKKYINLFFYKYFSKLRLTKESFLWIFILINTILIIFGLNGYNRTNKINFIFSVLCICIFILMLIISLYLLYKEYQIKLLNKNIIEENKYIKEVAKQEEEFKHNLVNNLLGIKTVGNKKVNNLIDELILEYKTDYKNITNINDLPEGILSIVYRKAYDENIENLNLVVDNLLKKELVDILSPKNYNQLCTSIGILFDNALDAIKSCKEKIIEITLLEDNDFIYYVQKNSFNNIIDLEKTGTKDFTTKKNGHGIGLNYIKKLKNLEIKNTIINNMFITNLKIKKIKM